MKYEEFLKLSDEEKKKYAESKGFKEIASIGNRYQIKVPTPNSIVTWDEEQQMIVLLEEEVE